MSKKMFVILKREFFTRARSKSFIIGTLIFPLLLVLIFGGYYFFSKMSQPSTKSFYVVDKSDLVYEKLSRSLQDTLKTGAPRFEFIKYNNTENNFDRQIEKIRQDVINEKVYGYMIIPENIIEQRKIEYKASNVGDFEDQRIIRNTISDIIKSHRLENLGLDSDKIEEEISKSRVRLATSQITEEGEVEKSGGASFLLSYIMTYIMFLMIIIYGQITMRSVITEKNERITESIVSAVKPFSLMSGKILGICLLGLVQMLVFGLIISILVGYQEPIFSRFGLENSGLMQVISDIHFTPFIFATFLFYFVVGFIFYSSLAAAIGAMVSTTDEGQQFFQAVVFLLLISFFMVMSVVQNPNTGLAFWGSLVPFFTPVVMFGRITATSPTLPSGFYLSIFTLLGSTALLIWLTAKIYRVGILMYGKKASLKEVVKWIRY